MPTFFPKAFNRKFLLFINTAARPFKILHKIEISISMCMAPHEGFSYYLWTQNRMKRLEKSKSNDIFVKQHLNSNSILTLKITTEAVVMC